MSSSRSLSIPQARAASDAVSSLSLIPRLTTRCWAPSWRLRLTPPARVVSGGYYARPRRHQLSPALGVVESSSATETSRPPAPSTAKERRMRYRACDNTGCATAAPRGPDRCWRRASRRSPTGSTLRRRRELLDLRAARAPVGRPDGVHHRRDARSVPEAGVIPTCPLGTKCARRPDADARSLPGTER